jgi:hypothetical protein
MRVFASIKGDDINPTATTSHGPRLLREFLLYAERGHLESSMASAKADTDSLLEQDVFSELTRRGVTVVPQVGVQAIALILVYSTKLAPDAFCAVSNATALLITHRKRLATVIV